MQNKLLDILNSMIDLLRLETIKKKQLVPCCQELEEFLLENFKNVPEPEERIFSRYSEDERLRQLENQIQKVQNKPECGMIEAVSLFQDKLREFLKKYKFGFLRSCCLSNGKTLEVEIGCSITKGSGFHEHDVSDRIEFDLQMNFLKGLGINVTYEDIENQGKVYLVADGKTMEVIYDLLQIELKAWYIRLDVLENHDGIREINKIRFYVSPENLLEKDWTTPEIVLPSDKDCFNPDEVNYIYHNIKQMNHSYDMISEVENMIPTCYSLMKSYFSDICEIVGFDGLIMQERQARRNKIREQSKEIKEKERELGKAVCGNGLNEVFQNLQTRLEKEIFEKTNFQCLKMKVTPHNVEMEFSFATGYFFRSKEMKQMTDDELRSVLDCSEGSISDEDIHVLCTEKNMNYLQDTASECVPCSLITGTDVQNHWSLGYNYIRKFTLTTDNLSVLF